MHSRVLPVVERRVTSWRPFPPGTLFGTPLIWTFGCSVQPLARFCEFFFSLHESYAFLTVISFSMYCAYEWIESYDLINNEPCQLPSIDACSESQSQPSRKVAWITGQGGCFFSVCWFWSKTQNALCNWVIYWHASKVFLTRHIQCSRLKRNKALAIICSVQWTRQTGTLLWIAQTCIEQSKSYKIHIW